MEFIKENKILIGILAVLAFIYYNKTKKQEVVPDILPVIKPLPQNPQTPKQPKSPYNPPCPGPNCPS